MKNIFKTMLTSIMLSSSLLLSSCGSFSMEDDYTIGEIKTEKLQNGDILITIIYQDEELQPTTFIVPKGEAGEDGIDGNSIVSVTPTVGEDGKSTILTIKFSDEKFEDVVVNVPYGTSITGITTPVVDEKGNTVFKITYSNGTESSPISIPQGKPGKDGEDGKKIELQLSETHIQYRYEGDVQWTDLISLEDITGNGIESIDISKVDEFGNKKYSVEISYTDGKEVSIPLDDVNRWYSEYYSPSPLDGYDGDMWYNKNIQSIFTKENGVWIELVSFAEETEILCKVTFNLNTKTNDVLLPSGTQLSHEIPKGSTFYNEDKKIPEPMRYGYDFAGWYTTPDPTVVNGIFTDLTIITKDEFVLYAKWVEKESTDEESEEEQTN